MSDTPGLDALNARPTQPPIEVSITPMAPRCACGQPAEVGPYTGDADHCRAHWGIADRLTAEDANLTTLEQAARLAVEAYDSGDLTERQRGNMSYSEALESAMWTLRDVLARLNRGAQDLLAAEDAEDSAPCVDPDHGIGDHPCDQVLGAERAREIRESGHRHEYVTLGDNEACWVCGHIWDPATDLNDGGIHHGMHEVQD